MRKVTALQIRQIFKKCSFEPNRPFMRSAIDSSDPDYCRKRAKEFIDEYEQTDSIISLHNAIEMLALSVAMQEVNAHNQNLKEQRRGSKKSQGS